MHVLESNFPIINKIERAIPKSMVIERGETQKDVNAHILKELLNRFDSDSNAKAMDLPCGKGHFLNYLHRLFPNIQLNGADIINKNPLDKIRYYQMDLTKQFTLPQAEKYDLITSISGVMMFGNTLNFIENCAGRLNTNGVFVLTNDNSSTMIDRLAFFALGRHRQFPLVYEDHEEMTQNIPIQELVRIMRNCGLNIEKIEYTSFYWKDLKYLPVILLAAPFQFMYIRRLKTLLPQKVIRQMFSYKQLIYKHYIIYAVKK